MAGFIGEDQVRRIKEAVDLVQLMGEYTNLKKAGANFSGCCPFHQERTPSMHVYTDQQTYHCFGCQKHGDVITLVREKEHLDFNDAMEVLARRAGIELKFERGGTQMPRSERDQFVQAVEFAVKFYEDVLWNRREGQEAREYLASRGLSEAVCKRFRLGWAPGGGALIEEARRKRIDVQHLAKNDLAVDRNGRWVDRFFERVMFPIGDRFGNPIAFSGRLLPAAEKAAKEAGRGVGKYINSTDTPLYHKGNAVFNLHRARTVCREKGRLIVMEGPTDVMAADDAGFGECVAVLGTAMTPEHAKQLGSLVGHGGRLILLFDGDRAGQTNSLKAVRTCLSVGVPTWVAVIPNEMDPAELLKEDPTGGGKGAFEEVLAAARADGDHLLRNLAPRPYELDHRALLEVADQILACLRPLKDPELVSLYLRDMSSYLNLDQQRLQRRLAGGTEPAAEAGKLRIELSEPLQVILHILVQRPDLRAKAFDQMELEPSFFPEPWRVLADHLMVQPDSDHHVMLALPAVEEHQQLRVALFGWISTALTDRVPAIGEPEPYLAASILDQSLERLKDEVKRLGLAIAEAERSKDFAAADRLSADRLELTRRIKDLAGHSRLSAH
jgi:DNA primase